NGTLLITVAMMTPIAPKLPARKPNDNPSRLPKFCETRPTKYADKAEPSVNNAAGTPAKLAEPNISLAIKAPTVIPAANPAPPNIGEITTTVNVRLYKFSTFSGDLTI